MIYLNISPQPKNKQQKKTTKTQKNYMQLKKLYIL